MRPGRTGRATGATGRTSGPGRPSIQSPGPWPDFPARARATRTNRPPGRRPAAGSAPPPTFRKAGEMLWTYRPARRPGLVRPLTVGPTEVYLVQGEEVTILDRADGKMKYTENVKSTASAAPAADSFALYIPLDTRKI